MCMWTGGKTCPAARSVRVPATLDDGFGHVRAAPGFEALEGVAQLAALVGELVLDPRRHQGNDATLDDVELFEALETVTEGTGVAAADGAGELIEAALAVHQLINDARDPFLAQQREGGANGAVL